MSSSLRYICSPVDGMKIFAAPVDDDGAYVHHLPNATKWAITDCSGYVLCPLSEEQRKVLWDILIDPFTETPWRDHFTSDLPTNIYVEWHDLNDHVYRWYPPTGFYEDAIGAIRECIAYAHEVKGNILLSNRGILLYVIQTRYTTPEPTDFTVDFLNDKITITFVPADADPVHW